MIIYKVVNKCNGMTWIGQTIGKLAVRWSNHCNGYSKCPYLSNAIKKYGKENFSVEEIAKYSTLEDLNSAEEYYIDFYNCLAPNGYNLQSGGGNKFQSQETKEKIALAQKGPKNHRFGKTPWNKGKSWSEEHKIKLRKPKTKEHKLKISLAKKGKKQAPRTAKACANISNALKGKPKSAEHRLNLSLALKGRSKNGQCN